MTRLYAYVGPDDIREKTRTALGGHRIASLDDLRNWLRETEQELGGDGDATVTFIVDAEGSLCVADRHSEHVACASGEPVRSAGEMNLRVRDEGVEVTEVSDQSTGYCPEPPSWPEVAAALDRIAVPHPGGFTSEIVFRRCPSCGQRNIVKDGWFYCGVCDGRLPKEWNFG